MESTRYGWLNGLLRKKHSALQMCLFIGWSHQKGILVMTYAVLSLRIHHLPDVRDDTLDIMYWAMPVVRSINQHFLAHNIKARWFMGL